MNKNLFFVFLVAILVGCNSGQKVEQSKAQPKVVEAPKAPVTREEMRTEAKSVAKQVAANTKDEKKVVDLRSLSTREKKKGVVVRRKLTDFYALHLGLPNVKNGVEVPDTLPVSFDANMAKFWEGKVSRENVSDSTLSKTPEILDRYMKSDRGYTTLGAFITHTNSVVSHARNSLDWNRLCLRYKLGNEKSSKKGISKCQVLKNIVYSLSGKDFIAYGMTELFSNEPTLNVLYLDMLLQNAGTSYIMHIPAMHDKMLSLGFYQFTSFAIRKDDEGTEGVSVVNGFVKDGGMKIPDSVAFLVGDDHHVAALYFAINNFAKLINRLDEKSLNTLSSKYKNYKEEMVMFIAAAHHLPGVAYKHTQKWIRGGMKSNLLGAYRSNVGNYNYAIKTQGNLIALSKKY